MNIFEDVLIVLCSDCHISLFSLEKKQNDTSRRFYFKQNKLKYLDYYHFVEMSVNINKIIEFSIEIYLSGNPFSVLSIGLSELRVEVGLNKSDAVSYINSNSYQKYIESILLNVSGRLLMFQRDKNSPLLLVKNMKKIKSVKLFISFSYLGHLS